MSKSELLDEYIRIHDEINNMRNQIKTLQKETKLKLSLCKSEKEKNKILESFKSQLNEIKDNKKLKDQYKQLMDRQSNIKNQLISEDKKDNLFKQDTPQIRINDLLSKYKSQSAKSIKVIKKSNPNKDHDNENETSDYDDVKNQLRNFL